MTSSDRPVGAVLVVGGGIAGIQASLDLAEQGFRVYLAESKSAIGGHMAQLDKTFPTNDCAMCTISPKLVDAGRHPNIDLLVDTEVVRVDGAVGDFTVTVRRKPRYIDTTRCVGCGDCAAVCPVTRPDEFNEGLAGRKAVFKLYPQAVPGAYAIEKLGVAPCRAACPVNQRAQGYIALIAEGRYREAFRVIKEDNPFPSVCGRTCHHPCEGHCTRALVDEPVGIMSLKRFVMDYALAYGREPVKPAARTRPQWVAVVGAGPAGLTAAHDLAKLGYGVTIFEALPVAGGMMRVGIPAHRLPKGVLQQDIDDILALGVVLKTNSPVRDPQQLLKQGYDAVCLATGISTRDHSLGVEGEGAAGVISAATFLRKVSLGEPITIGGRVAVIGGGITALDAAAVARRLGAENVYLVLDKPRGELPAYAWEMAAVESEGIQLYEHTTAVGVLAENGSVCAIELARTGKGVTTDARGRRRPTTEPGSEFTLPVDTVIGTVGQQSDLTFLDPAYDDLTGDPATLAATTPGLFIVGGRKTGATYIIEAVALGHRVATSIDRHLRGVPLETPLPAAPPALKFTKDDMARRVHSGEIRLQPRIEAPLLPLEERVTSFREVVLGLNEHQARAEARRCLQCGICSECLACVYACGVYAIDHNMVERQETLQVGSIILAPGYQPYQAARASEFGLGRYPNVVSALQFERLLSASGPTAGHVLRPSDGAPARRIAFLQCIGSRDQEHDYCSAVCCMYATKEAVLTREHDPQAQAHVFLMDMRAFSKGYEAYYRRAREQHGVEYTRCRVSEVREDPASANLILRYVPVNSGQWEVVSGQSESAHLTTDHSPLATDVFDLVVLSIGMEISPDVRRLAADLGVALDANGFCETSLVDPVETSRPGIYAVGPFREPKDIPESVIDAGGAAGSASARLARARGDLARTIEYPPERDVSAEAPRVGVFVCHCGSNIAGFVDVEAVAAGATRLPGVVHADHLLYACSQDSTATIQRRISEHQLNRVVVASCTPLTHGPLFQDCLRQAGLNEGMLAMANIRNQCSWVHSDDRRMATAKAEELVRMAVARVVSLEPLYRKPVPIQAAALVIGGGPAGMTAALTLAEQGHDVHLVEREAELGGQLRHLQSLTPRDGRPAPEPRAYLDDLLARLQAQPRVSVHRRAQVVEMRGSAGNFTSRVRSVEGTTQEIRHAVTIVATGGQEYRGPEYGYGADPRILTQQEFEDRLSRPQDLGDLRHVVMIQCVGPAEHTCTRTCCAVALKNALRLKDLLPAADVTILYRDIRTYGFKERLYTAARRRGVRFLRYDEDHKPRIDPPTEAGVLNVHAWEPALAQELSLTADMLVLSMPMVPAEGSRALATTLKVPVDQDGWFLEAHIKLRPVEFASSGLYLAGAAHYPKLLDESVVQARAAASRAATILSRPTLSAGGIVAQVRAEACVGCLTCVRVCPLGVPVVRPELAGVGRVEGAAYIEPTICQGCGTCVGECPAGAIELLHYRRDQVEQQVLALFAEAPAAGGVP
jgi:heterodisulfide reductase subunit A-like polyferredoxin